MLTFQSQLFITFVVLIYNNNNNNNINMYFKLKIQHITSFGNALLVGKVFCFILHDCYYCRLFECLINICHCHCHCLCCYHFHCLVLLQYVLIFMSQLRCIFIYLFTMFIYNSFSLCYVYFTYNHSSD